MEHGGQQWQDGALGDDLLDAYREDPDWAYPVLTDKVSGGYGGGSSADGDTLLRGTWRNGPPRVTPPGAG